MSQFKLPLPPGNEIKTIIHLSDLHIRGESDVISCRYEEYMCVFDNLLKKLNSNTLLVEGYGIIVITGDIFHHKNRFSAVSVKLFSYLLDKLSTLAPVCMILGNHDYNSILHDTPDMLECFYELNKNITYLKDTGIYYAGECFALSVVSVKDTLLMGAASGMQEKLPEIPYDPNVKIKIALFHGSVNKCLLENFETTVTDGYPLNWFKHFDLVLLGDIHLQQSYKGIILDTEPINFGEFGKNNPTWAYAGSLIQQNFGELPFFHGYLEWNLITCQIIPYWVENPRALIKTKYDSQLEEWIVAQPTKTKLPLFDLFKKFKPKYVAVRTIGEYTFENLTKLKAIEDEISKVEYFTSADKTPASNKNKDETADSIQNISKLNSVDSWTDFIESHGILNECKKDWKSWLHNPEKLLFNTKTESNPAVSALLIKKNSEIQDSINKLKSSIELANGSEHADGKRLHLDHLYMKRILCFSECTFDFNSLENTVALLYGPNGYGKSSFLEGICIALFGDGIPSRHTAAMGASVINSTMEVEGVGHTIIRFTLGKKRYELTRKLAKNKIFKLRHNECTLTLIDEPNTKGYSGATAVNGWVKENIGTIKSFLLTCLVSQSSDEDFLSLPPANQIGMINQSLKLDSVNALTDFLHVAINAYKYIRSHLDTLIKNCPIANNEADTSKPDLQQEKNVLEENFAKLKDEKDAIDIKWAHMNKVSLQISGIDENILQIEKELESICAECAQNETIEDICHKKANVTCLLTELRMKYEDYCKYKIADSEEVFDDITKPPIELHEFHDMKIKCVQWRKQHTNIAKQFGDLSNTQMVEEKYNELTMAVEENTNKIVDMEKQKQNLDKQELDLSSEINKIDTDTLIPPRLSHTEVRAKLKNIYDIKKNIDKKKAKYAALDIFLKKIEELNSQLENLNNQKTTLENQIEQIDNTLEGCPYNSECEACRAQPLRIQKNKLEDELSSIKTACTEANAAYKNHIKNHNIEKRHTQFADLHLWLTEYDSKLAEEEELNKLKVQCKLYDKFSVIWKELNDSLKECRGVNIDLGNELGAYRKNLSDINDDLKELVKYRTYLSEKEQNKSLTKELIEYEKYFKNQKRKIKEDISKSNEEYNKFNAMIASIEKMKILNEKLDDMKEIQTCQPFYNRSLEYEKAIDKIREDLVKINMEIKINESSQKQATEEKEKLDLILNFAADIDETLSVLSLISSSFGSYKNWLYNSKILPALIGYVNGLIGSVEPNLSLKAELVDNNNIHFSIMDKSPNNISIRDSWISLLKASGFQKAIISIACRIGLNQIGACNIYCDQLFLDEPFTSCDDAHLAKLPQFIQKLVRIYKGGITIVSHLPILQDSVEKVISIHRENRISRINFVS